MQTPTASGTIPRIAGARHGIRGVRQMQSVSSAPLSPDRQHHPAHEYHRAEPEARHAQRIAHVPSGRVKPPDAKQQARGGERGPRQVGLPSGYRI